MDEFRSGNWPRVPRIKPSSPGPGWLANWTDQLERSDVGTPILPAEFVAAQGPRVRLIDVRDPQDFIGPLGYIPGSDWIPNERLESLPERLGPLSPLVIISRNGERGGEAARMLEERGMAYVAAMSGGIAQWLSLGFSTTRDPAILDRCDILRRIDVPTVEPDAKGLTIEQVEEHIGDPLSVRWIKLAALVLHAQLSCIDGRGDRGILGAPGGDAGQFLLAMAATETILERKLDAHTIGALLERRIDALGAFYMHTDHNARAAALDSMRADPRLAAALAGFRDPAELRQLIRRPPLALREPIIEHLCRPSAIGCGHIRLALQHSADYRLRPGLVADFLRAFFLARWEGAFRAEYESLQGTHGERAVLSTRIEGKLQPFSPVPLISPSSLGSQMFVNHPQVSQYLLQLLVDFLLLQTDLIPEFARNPRDALLAEAEALDAIHVNNSLLNLARGLPIYSVEFRKGGEVHIEYAGVVG